MNKKEITRAGEGKVKTVYMVSQWAYIYTHTRSFVHANMNELLERAGCFFLVFFCPRVRVFATCVILVRLRQLGRCLEVHCTFQDYFGPLYHFRGPDESVMESAFAS